MATSDTDDFVTLLNLVAGTTGLDAPGAANAWAGTSKLDMIDALNRKNGTVGGDLNTVVSALCSVSCRDAVAALKTLVANVHSPKAATVLTATPISETSVTLTWTAVTGAYYKVYRSADNIHYDCVATIPNGTLTYTDTNLVSDRTYSYKASTNIAQFETFSNVETVELVSLPAAWFDLDERAISAGTIDGGSGLLVVWPDNSGNGRNAVIDPDDGSTADNGFVVGSAHGHSTVTSTTATDTRLTVKASFPDADINGDIATVIYMVTLGADAPDGSEMVTLSYDPSGGNYYEDTYSYVDDAASSEVLRYNFGEQTGGPQIGGTWIVTKVHTVDSTIIGHGPISHVDGFVASPQTDYSSTAGGDIHGPDVMIANYPGGGFCLAGRWHRMVCYPGRLTAAQRLMARQILAAQAADDGITVTLYDESTTDPSSAIGTVLGQDTNPYVGAEVYAIGIASPNDTLGESVTGADGSFTIPGIPFGATITIAVHPLTADDAVTYPAISRSVGYLNAASAGTVDGSGDPLDFGTFTMLASIDPTVDADLVESYDADDLTSITIVADQVHTWAAQEVGRPAFVLTAGVGPTSGVRSLNGANMLGFTGESPDTILTAAADGASGSQTIILVGVRDTIGPPYPAIAGLVRYDSRSLLDFYDAGKSYVTGRGNSPTGASASYATLGAGGFATVYSFGAGAGDDVIASSYKDAIFGASAGNGWTILPAWTDLSLTATAGYTWAIRYFARIDRLLTVDDAAAMCSWLISTMLPGD